MLSVFLLAAALTGGATPATPPFPAARSLVPYVKHQEVDPAGLDDARSRGRVDPGLRSARATMTRS